MGRMPKLVERGKKDRRLGEPSGVSWEEIEALELDPRVELIRQLIPLGLAEVGRLLEEEVEQLAGRRHARKAEDDRRYPRGPGHPKPGQIRGQRPWSSSSRLGAAGRFGLNEESDPPARERQRSRSANRTRRAAPT